MDADQDQAEGQPAEPSAGDRASETIRSPRRRWIVVAAIGAVVALTGASVSVAALTRDQPAEDASPAVSETPGSGPTPEPASAPAETSAPPAHAVCMIDGVQYHDRWRLDGIDLPLDDRAFYAFDAPRGSDAAISPDREISYTAMPGGATLVHDRIASAATSTSTDDVFTLVDATGDALWSIELPGVRSDVTGVHVAATPLTSGVAGRLLVAIPDGDDTGTVLHVIDTETGEPLAQRAVDGAFVLESSRRQGATADGIRVVESAEHFFERSGDTVSALDPDTLDPRWSVTVSPAVYPRIVGGVLDVYDKRYDATTGAELPWSGRGGLGMVGSVLTDLSDGTLVAIDPRSGEPCWSVEGVVTVAAHAEGAFIVDTAGRTFHLGEDGSPGAVWASGPSDGMPQILGDALVTRDVGGWSVYAAPGVAPVRVSATNSSWGAWTEIIGYDETTLVLGEGVYTGVLGVADLATGTVTETEKWDHDTTAVSGRLLLDTRLLPAQEYGGLPPVVARDGTYFVLERG